MKMTAECKAKPQPEQHLLKPRLFAHADGALTGIFPASTISHPPELPVVTDARSPSLSHPLFRGMNTATIGLIG